MEQDVRKCAAALVVPKPRFFEWLAARPPRHPALPEAWSKYVPEQDTVWIIPRLGSFGTYENIQAYFQRIKPRLFEAELSRFVSKPEEMDRITAELTFDDLFELKIRNVVEDARDL